MSDTDSTSDITPSSKIVISWPLLKIVYVADFEMSNLNTAVDISQLSICFKVVALFLVNFDQGIVISQPPQSSC